jgi:hypothetical protein
MTELEIGVEGVLERVSERGTGVKMMQEWKFVAERKACVCNGNCQKWIGKRPATKGQ